MSDKEDKSNTFFNIMREQISKEIDDKIIKELMEASKFVEKPMTAQSIKDQYDKWNNQKLRPQKLTMFVPVPAPGEPNANGDSFSEECIEKLKSRFKDALHAELTQYTSIVDNIPTIGIIKNILEDQLKSISMECEGAYPKCEICVEVDKNDPQKINMTIGGPPEVIEKMKEAQQPTCRPVKLKDSDEWQKIGVIGVDAGLCLLGDPCYILPQKLELPDGEDLSKGGLDYREMLNAMYKHTYAEEDDESGFLHMHSHQAHSFNYALGHEGKGICVSSGFGDGTYDVFVKTKENCVAEMKVVFITDEDG